MSDERVHPIRGVCGGYAFHAEDHDLSWNRDRHFPTRLVAADRARAERRVEITLGAKSLPGPRITSRVAIPRTGLPPTLLGRRKGEIIATTHGADGTLSTLPDTGSFEILRTGEDRSGAAFHTVPIVMPHLNHAPVIIDTSWHGRHGISRFSSEVLRRVHIPRRFATGGASPASPADIVAPWRRRLGRDDVVYTPGFNAGLTRARQVLTLHDLIHLENEEEGSIAKRAYYERLVRPAVRRAGTVLTVSETSRTAIREWLRDDRVDIVNVGNGCSDQFFQPSTTTRSGHDFVYVGNLKPHKNPAPVFAAIQLVPQARLTVVTGDVEGVHLLARAHGIADRVRAVGSLTDGQLRELYAASSALLFPSLREGFGLPAVEALAVGTPVIHWSGCETIAEIVGRHGAAIDDASDARAWADGMDAAMRGHVSSGRPEGWRDRWSWDGVARRVDRALRDVAIC